MKLSLAKRSKILVAEDQVLARSHLHYALEQLGFRNIEYVDRPSHILTALQEDEYDAIICSYSLRSEQGGYFLLEQLIKEQLLPLSSAFIFTSADTSIEVVHAIVELQPDELITKPFSVNELDKRLSRVFARKHALRRVYSFMDKNEYNSALLALESFLLQPEQESFFPLALKIKGDLYLLTERYHEAIAFFDSVINTQGFNWARLGLASCLLALNKLDEAEREIIQLAMHRDVSLSAYDLLSKLQIKQGAYDDALESTVLASDISPRNITRHKQAIDLARITHDYARQFISAKKMVQYAKNSVHDTPDIYLTAARCGVDFAMTSQKGQVDSIVKQTNDYLRQLSKAHPRARRNEELSVIEARLYYLKDDVEKAQSLLTNFQRNFNQYSTEALLDRAKALHEIGIKGKSLEILDVITARQKAKGDDINLLATYLEQEKEEKQAISHSPKSLNNSAVNQYKEGELARSYATFAQAFRIMPKNPAIALNYLQAIYKLRHSGTPLKGDVSAIVKKCKLTLADAPLNKEQQARYETLKIALG